MDFIEVNDTKIILKKVSSYFVPCVPYAQPRQRQAVRKKGDLYYTHNYCPKDHPVNGFKEIVIWHTKVQGIKTITGPLALKLNFFFPMPSTVKSNVIVPHDKKPDWDNLEKGVMDALKKAGVYNDDKQVFSPYQGGKYYTPNESDVGVHIEIYIIE